ncbi:Secreted protein OS=Tsukamurella paurometabola (strain ATCC 8368 / DSM / CCUG 35730 / CIP 100753/ JCM 10117 / KCTC 9821 / NBRC 16120 / NCIMB 702349 / NCTC 13040) OX=521096 GN=Tpau_4165 PE=4 SV=1 [Tsukamurella paurometabola]|uniref:Secreted protein n=1 Tax=Tsukamurella paurometabola (strain ATCC 8368 / DSM 20162 / CCUG 35730 / CIP 100753 / JCM 10117 / KCTC 9821 / NBRC 16120 / NCIMB 702349 / NCTC 13040) TaxID=521096 RepID=D5UP25_TSUPD|nr:hypothetical protein [Tsukamurella paurometabola]ADG80734.1 conserved hypothetical protein [Tsukamurella paurometabola DSM 20162]SUP40756.1 Uncharacterised protein [Tsukamurella paurometabola]
MNPQQITTRTAGVAVAVAAIATCAIGPAGAEPAPAPAPAKPVTATATCSSANPMFVVGGDMVNWKVNAKVLRPGQIEFAGTGNAGARDLVLSQFASNATLSWNNTTTGKYGSVRLNGVGGLPTLNRIVVNTGKGAVTYNVVIRTGAGTEWIGTQVSTPCVGTIVA